MTIQIPENIKPEDHRFGSGPSKIRPEAIASLGQSDAQYILGTSHRQAPVKAVVASLQVGLASMLNLPGDYQIVLGIGGATAFFDIAAFNLIERRSQHLVFGEFSSKFAQSAAAAPFIDDPEIIESEPGTHPISHRSDVDTYAMTLNETSTGVSMRVERPGPGAFTIVDGTSGVGGVPIDATETDVLFFSPQKGLAGEGGLWLAAMSPAAIERVNVVSQSRDYIPPFFDLSLAIDNSTKHQTYNTPPLIGLMLIDHQLQWINQNGGGQWALKRCATSAETLYSWAETSPYAEPFVKDPSQRSAVTGTIDFDESVDAKLVASTLRENGIVDVEPYRKLGRNQLRVAMFPAIDPSDIEALTVCIDYVVSQTR